MIMLKNIYASLFTGYPKGTINGLEGVTYNPNVSPNREVYIKSCLDEFLSSGYLQYTGDSFSTYMNSYAVDTEYICNGLKGMRDHNDSINDELEKKLSDMEKSGNSI